MIKKLDPAQIRASIPSSSLTFTSTQTLLEKANTSDWIAQTEAQESAQFGLSLEQFGFNLLVLGDQGSGRTSLMYMAMQQAAHSRRSNLRDLIALCAFERGESPVFLHLPAGQGVNLKFQLDQFVRHFIQIIAPLFSKPELDLIALKQTLIVQSKDFLTQTCHNIQQQIQVQASDALLFAQYLQNLQRDFNEYVANWQPRMDDESPFEHFINENWLNRYRVNVLVNRADEKTLPIVYDNNPSLQSLFGCMDSHTDGVNLPEYMRLRAGHLLKADGGMLLVHLRDLIYDQQEGSVLIEKLQRFLRNGTLLIEEAGSGQPQNASYAIQAPLQVDMKLILMATREDYYQVLEDFTDFFAFFPIKIEFAERFLINESSMQSLALLIAKQCHQHQIPHATPEAVTALIAWMQRLEEDQYRVNTCFSMLEKMLLQSASMTKRRQGELISQQDVQAAIETEAKRNHYVESQVRQSILDGEVLIQVHGEAVGQINGLTHTDLGDASFGTPVRISARCFASRKGIVHIDREVRMSGAHHDKGLLIMQSWFNASFAVEAPLHLGASIVFEQEYSIVDGDSASCAELFTLLSALSGQAMRQGIAVTGALNQHGEVLPIGGLNEKIEGYFRVCKDLGLDGKQGVLIPARNQRHLMLGDEIVQAVRDERFAIYTMDNVVEGITFLTDIEFGLQNENGDYPESSLMGRAQKTLRHFYQQVTNKRHG